MYRRALRPAVLFASIPAFGEIELRELQSALHGAGGEDLRAVLLDDFCLSWTDLIITKSVSRFARNTVDSLSTIRQLKEHNTEVFFEKEYIQNGGNP